MKVLFLTNIPAPYRVSFFNELGKACELVVLYELRSASDRNAMWKSGDAGYFREVFLDGIRLGADKALSLSVTRYLKDRSFDIIVVGGYSTPTGMLAIEYLSSKGIRFALNCDGGIVKKDAPVKTSVKRHFIGKADWWLSPSRYADDYLTNYGARNDGIHRYPFTSLYEKDIIAEPVSSAARQELRKALGIGEEKVIVSVGQFIHRKGFDILLKAGKSLDGSTGVYIIGGKPTEEYLQLVEELQLKNVHFLDFKTKEEIFRYYKAADLFVLPTREDIWGLVVNEAMACGLPVVTTDRCVAGLELVKNGENGFIVPAEDVKALADRIETILDEKKTAEDMSRNSLSIIKNYTIEKMASTHMKIFESKMGAV